MAQPVINVRVATCRDGIAQILKNRLILFLVRSLILCQSKFLVLIFLEPKDNNDPLCNLNVDKRNRNFQRFRLQYVL